MLSAYAIAGALGLFLGFRYKVAGVIALSVTLVVAGTVVLTLAGWSLLSALGASYASSAALQFGYLAGLAVTCVASRGRHWPRAMRRYVRNYGPLLVTSRPGTR